MANILVTQVVLDCPCVLPVICELITSSVSQHVGMDWKFNLRRTSRPCHDFPNAGGRQWSFPLAREHIGAVGILPLQSAQCSQFWPTDRMGARSAILKAIDVKQPLGKVDLVPAQGNQFAHPQGMAVGNENHSCVPVPVPPLLLSGSDNLLNLGFGQVFTAPPL